MFFNKRLFFGGRARALCAAVLAVCLMTGFAAPACAGPLSWLFGGGDDEAVPAATAAATPAPVVNVKASALQDDGMIRVQLKSLEKPQQLHITLAGCYSVENDPGFRFDRDARLTLSEADGNVYMAINGLTINMGQSLTLTRHAAAEGEENGIYIDESEKKAIYCGDLRVCADNGGLDCVLKLHIEDYLYGVVAYEMSDSFPIEALKAQAVAARTYAMQRKWSAGKREYDLVDTTADQVYKGFSAEYANVIEAVNATRGVVGVYNGGFATCYYTASNGGQTALASQIWGGTGSDGYLGMTEDPYDLENPSSLENSITVSPECEGSGKLKDMLMSALSAKMREEGLSDRDWEFERIEAITPVSPRAEGSLMCEALEFTLSVKAPQAAVSTQAPEATAQTEMLLPDLDEIRLEQAASEQDRVTRQVNVRLSTYEDIKDGLSLGLNGSDYEVVAVETQAGGDGAPESFTIIMRRFGHGVGMSQRGAQWMAKTYAKNWMEILNFYYPGMSVERIEWPEHSLSVLEELPDSVGAARPLPTPTPSPAPLPALKKGEYYAKVTLETKSSSLNVRETPSTAARIVDQLANGRRLIVSGEVNEDGWVPIHTAEISGYVKLEYLKKE